MSKKMIGNAGLRPGVALRLPRAVFWRPFRALEVGTIGFMCFVPYSCVLEPIQGTRGWGRLDLCVLFPIE